jgi:hypothetical protein
LFAIGWNPLFLSIGQEPHYGEENNMSSIKEAAERFFDASETGGWSTRGSPPI